MTYHTLKISGRSVELLKSIRDKWFPDEEEPMGIDAFIYVLACAVHYNNLDRRKKK